MGEQTSRQPRLNSAMPVSKEGFNRATCEECAALQFKADYMSLKNRKANEGKMIEIVIPGHAKLQLKHLILDYNGTLAVDGRLIDGVRESLEKLSGKLHIHVITADTFGKAQSGLSGIDCKLSILALDNQDIGKLEYVKNLGASCCVCIGNGRNDRLMLKEASLGLAVIQTEGVAFETLQASDIVCNSIVHALELLIYPLRLTASLRS